MKITHLRDKLYAISVLGVHVSFDAVGVEKCGTLALQKRGGHVATICMTKADEFTKKLDSCVVAVLVDAVREVAANE
jgi:hypothetical protein